MKRKYYPNKWKAIHDTPSDKFKLPDGCLTFDEFMDWKIAGYELPASVCCNVRALNLRNGKVKEYVYNYRHAARKKIRKLSDSGHYELSIVERETVHFIYPNDDII